MTWPRVRTVQMQQSIHTDNLIAQKILRDLKTKISSQSKKNFVLEKDVRYLDSRIALLVQNRMAQEEVRTYSTRGVADWLTIRSGMKSRKRWIWPWN